LLSELELPQRPRYHYCQLTNNQRYLFATDYEGWLYKFDVRNPARPTLSKKVRPIQYETLLSVHCDPDDEYMILGTPFSHAKIMQVENMTEVRQLSDGHKGKVTDAWFM